MSAGAGLVRTSHGSGPDAGFQLITALWSEDDARCFAAVGLPALLAPGNIPTIAASRDCAYQLYGGTESERIVQASPAYRRLARLMPVQFHSIAAIARNPAGRDPVHSEIYRHAIRNAAMLDAPMIFLGATMVIADGGLRALARAAGAGKRAVLAAALRVEREPVAAELARRFEAEDDAVVSLTPRELVGLALPHLSAAGAAGLYRGSSPVLDPSTLLWEGGSDGFLVRSFHLNPVLVHPRVRGATFSTSLQEDFVPAACPDPDEIHTVADSDEFCACILDAAAPAQNVMPRTGDDRDIARWAWFNAHRHHRELVQREIRFHRDQADGAAWARAAQEAGAAVAQVFRDLADPGLLADARAGAGYLPLHLVTPVWGREYCELFVEVTLPTMLSAGNIPALPNRTECRYVIYTDAAGRGIIEGSRAYGLLKQHLATEIRGIDEKVENKYDTSSNCYREAIREAAQRHAAAVFLIPDMILADGSIRNIAHVLRCGKRQILMTGTRVVKETAVPAVLERRAQDGAITVPPADLIRLCIAHIHPITRTHFYESDGDEFHPSTMCWPVGTQGFVLRCFHLHPVAMVPTAASTAFEGTIDDDMLEGATGSGADLHIVTDSDQIQWCEMSPRARTVPTPPREGIDTILQWMVNSTNAFHRSLIWSTIRVHTGAPAGPEWDAVEARADAVVRMLMTYHDVKAQPVQAQPASPKTLRALLPEARVLAREFVSVAERHLAQPGVWRRGFPASIVPGAVAAATVGAFVGLRSFWRLGRMVRNAMATTTHLCKLCQADSLLEIASYATLARVTSDTRPWPAGGRIAVCRACGAIQKIPDARWQKEIGAIYGSYQSYPLSGGMEQSVYDPQSGVAQRRSIRIVENLVATLGLPETGSVLDLGCGNGVTLDAFSRLRPRWELSGQDLDARSLPQLQGIPGFKTLHTGAPSSIRGQHTIVSLVHAFEHFPDPLAALNDIRHLIAPDGWLFIQVPDSRSNPFDLVVADHLLHFTLETLVAMVEAAGYAVHTASDSLIVKELSLVARPLAGARAPAPRAPDAAAQASRRMLNDNLDWLRVTAADAETIAARGGFGLFGTAIAATWLFGIIGERVEFFVDEDQSRIGNSYMGRPVYSPGQVPAGAHVYVPLAPAVAAAIYRRLSHLPVFLHLPPGADRG